MMALGSYRGAGCYASGVVCWHQEWRERKISRKVCHSKCLQLAPCTPLAGFSTGTLKHCLIPSFVISIFLMFLSSLISGCVIWQPHCFSPLHKISVCRTLHLFDRCRSLFTKKGNQVLDDTLKFKTAKSLKSWGFWRELRWIKSASSGAGNPMW